MVLKGFQGFHHKMLTEFNALVVLPINRHTLSLNDANRARDTRLRPNVIGSFTKSALRLTFCPTKPFGGLVYMIRIMCNVAELTIAFQ